MSIVAPGHIVNSSRFFLTFGENKLASLLLMVCMLFRAKGQCALAVGSKKTKDKFLFNSKPSTHLRRVPDGFLLI